jgi:hypothetical protein
MMGRPSTYSEEIADRICERIIEGAALYKLCEEDGFPGEKTVYQWLDKHEDFAQKYARARELQQDREADKIVSIADETDDPNKARLQIDARKWRASKLAPKKYGDRLDLNHSGAIERISDQQLDARLSELLGKAGIGVAASGTAEAKEP